MTTESRDLLLTGLTVLGLAVAALSRFVVPLPADVVTAALIVAYLAGGVPAGLQAAREFFGRFRLDIDLLMVLAAVAAAAVGATLEGAVLLALFSASGTLEHRAMGRARRAVEALMALRPETAMRIIEGGLEEVPVIELRLGDRVILRPGSRVPVDGILREGMGEIDESTITGESMPVAKEPGAKLHEATVNLNAVLTMEVARRLEESTVARMIHLVTEAQGMKAPSERFSDWFGQRYTIAVLAGSIVAFFGFRAVGYEVDHALYHAATLLVAASPCAVVISVPAAILSALSAAARGGVLFKGGAALERLAAVKHFAFDKTGTLTTGRAEVTQVLVLVGDEAGLLELFAGIEAHSEHPIAAAIRRRAALGGHSPRPVIEVLAATSEGISGRDADGPLWAGNQRMAARMQAGLDDAGLQAAIQGSETVVFLGRGSQVIGAVTLADQPRATSRRGIEALRQGGVEKIAMLTGDRRAVALLIAEKLGLMPEEVHADLLAGDKVGLVDALARQGPVAFVGDGVNDATALARADVGIAMGAAGSEAALQAAEVALLSEDMERLAAAHRLARRTLRIIRQNLTFAIGAMVVLVTGGLFFELPLPLAVVGHEGGTLLVVLNGLRLLADPIRVA
jgi:heavy metal translocating P-type ATPase